MLDIDDFKAVNDTYGHPQGDAVLRHVARVLHENSRDADSPARYGGEELSLILPHTDLEGAHAIAERIRAAVEELRVARTDGDGVLRITASVGVAASTDGRQGRADRGRRRGAVRGQAQGQEPHGERGDSSRGRAGGRVGLRAWVYSTTRSASTSTSSAGAAPTPPRSSAPNARPSDRFAADPRSPGRTRRRPSPRPSRTRASGCASRAVGAVPRGPELRGARIQERAAPRTTKSCRPTSLPSPPGRRAARGTRAVRRRRRSTPPPPADVPPAPKPEPDCRRPHAAAPPRPRLLAPGAGDRGVRARARGRRGGATTCSRALPSSSRTRPTTTVSGSSSARRETSTSTAEP